MAKGAKGHSWLACSDYDPTTSTCRGYARNWYQVMAGQTFSTDRGRDNRPGVNFPAGLVCDQSKEARTNPVSNAYDATYPMATLTQGQTVTWRWPAKNHATVGVQRGVQVFISPTPDASTDAFIPTPIAQMDFSACNPRQANVDAADCQDTWVVPMNTQPGVHTLMWWWEFNQGEFYNSCADVTILASSGGGSPAPGPAPIAPANNYYTGLVCPPVAIRGDNGYQFDVQVTYTATANAVIGVDVVPEGEQRSVGRGIVNVGATTDRTQLAIITVTLTEELSIPSVISSTHMLRAWALDETSYDASNGYPTASAEAFSPLEIAEEYKTLEGCSSVGSSKSSDNDDEELRESKNATAALAVLFTLLMVAVIVYIAYRCNAFEAWGCPTEDSRETHKSVADHSKASEIKMVDAAALGGTLEAPDMDRSRSPSPARNPRVEGWTKHIDEISGKEYWFHGDTGESRWEPPAGYEV